MLLSYVQIDKIMNKSFTYWVEQGLAAVVHTTQCTWQYEHSMNFRLRVFASRSWTYQSLYTRPQPEKERMLSKPIKTGLSSIDQFLKQQHVVCVAVVLLFLVSNKVSLHKLNEQKCLFKIERRSYPFLFVALHSKTTFFVQFAMCPNRHEWNWTKPLIIANWNGTLCLQLCFVIPNGQMFSKWQRLEFFHRCMPSFVQCSILRSIISWCK